MNFLTAVSNAHLETCIHQVHFNETSAFNLKHFLVSEIVWWIRSKRCTQIADGCLVSPIRLTQTALTKDNKL